MISASHVIDQAAVLSFHHRWNDT